MWPKSTACSSNHKVSYNFCFRKVLLCPLVSGKCICSVCFSEQLPPLFDFLHGWQWSVCLRTKRYLCTIADHPIQTPSTKTCLSTLCSPSLESILSGCTLSSSSLLLLSVDFWVGRSSFGTTAMYAMERNPRSSRCSPASRGRAPFVPPQSSADS